MQIIQLVFTQLATCNLHFTRINAMAETDIEVQHFEHLAEYSIAICKECRHGVLPGHIKSHLQRMHRLKHRQADTIAERVRS